MRNALLVLHIIAVAAWLGANLTLGFAGSTARGADRAARRWWAATRGQMARVYYNAAGVIVLVSGVGLVLIDGPYEFSDLFVSIGFLAVVVGAVIGVFQLGPNTRALVEAIDEGDEAVEQRLDNRLATVALVDSLVLVVAIVAMVARWGM
jgi:putative copper export protein